MQIITRDYRQFTFSFKIIFVISDHHCALPLMAIADLKIIMEMEIINIAPVVLTPLFSQKSHYRPVFRHPVIPEFCLFLSVSAQSYLALPIPSYDLLKYRSFLPFYQEQPTLTSPRPSKNQKRQDPIGILPDCFAKII